MALLLRLALFTAAFQQPNHFYSIDSPQFVSLGTNLGEAYATDGGKLFRLGLRHPPGYPFVIAGGFAATGHDSWAIILFQIAAGLLTVWLTYRLALILLGLRAALFASLVLAVDPISIILTNYVQPETFFTFLIVAGALLWTRGLQTGSVWLGAAAGGLFGMAALVRPIALYLPAALIPASWLLQTGRWSRRLMFTGALLLLFAIPVGAWVARNVSITGVPIFSSADGHNLLYYRVALIEAEQEGLGFKETQARLRASVRQQAPPGANAAEVSRLERATAIQYLVDHPGATLEQTAKSLVLTMIGPGRAELLGLLDDSAPSTVRGPVQVTLIALLIALHVIILIGAVVGCYLLLRQRKYFALLLMGSVILYFTLATIVGSLGYSRYRVPMMPFIAIFAGYGFAGWRDRGSMSASQQSSTSETQG